MPPLYDQNAPKKTINLDINCESLKKAAQQHWLEQNGGAISAYNKSVGEQGAFGDKVRCF